MKEARLSLRSTVPIWLHITLLFLIWLINWLNKMDWTGVEFVNWVSALSGIVGALMTVFGAYLIARFQIRPVLLQHRSAEKKEQIERARECAKTVLEIMRLGTTLTNLLTPIFVHDDKTKSRDASVEDSLKKLFSGRDEWGNAFDLDREKLHETITGSISCCRSFVIYDDTPDSLVSARSELISNLKQTGNGFIEIHRALEKLHSANAMLKEQSWEELIETFSAWEAATNNITKLVERFSTELANEQDRLEQLIGRSDR